MLTQDRLQLRFKKGDHLPPSIGMGATHELGPNQSNSYFLLSHVTVEFFSSELDVPFSHFLDGVIRRPGGEGHVCQ